MYNIIKDGVNWQCTFNDSRCHGLNFRTRRDDKKQKKSNKKKIN